MGPDATLQTFNGVHIAIWLLAGAAWRLLAADEAWREPQDVGQQPCGAFRPQEFIGDGIVMIHACPRCGKRRWFCRNCCTDHHEDGWDACKPRGGDADRKL